MIKPDHIKGAKILIVEDDPVNLSILFTALNDMGFTVLISKDGESAIEQSRYKYPDLILLDILMPGVDGFETCRRLKAEPETHEIPVIFMTALNNTRDMVTGFEMGAVDYITKPFSLEEILARITTHLTLQQQRLELSELDTMKNKFFHIVSQDMKEVLSSLVSLSDFLVMSVTHIQGENIQNAAKMVEQSVQNAVKLLENLSDWANIQNGTIQLQPEIFNLQELILENVVQLRSNAREKKIELSYSVQDETYVYTDYDSTSTVLHNLILNALWFTGKGGKVDVSATVTNRFVEVAVTDTGIGIAHADVAKLFRIDQKFRRNGTAGEHGTGLGLVLCKDLIEMNGGQLQVESAVNLGSTFRFTLPRQEARLPG